MFGKTNYSLVKKDEKLISGKLDTIYVYQKQFMRWQNN